jgi:hypothetical protein
MSVERGDGLGAEEEPGVEIGERHDEVGEGGPGIREEGRNIEAEGEEGPVI